MERPACYDCPYWQSSIGGSVGACRKRSPSPANVDTDDGPRVSAEWPDTCHDDWCGEHPDFPAYLDATRRPDPRPTNEPRTERH